MRYLKYKDFYLINLLKVIGRQWTVSVDDFEVLCSN